MYKKELKNFPKEIVDKMLEYQVAQGNSRDIEVFEDNPFVDHICGGFDWQDTIEGEDFWEKVLTDCQFDIFFEKYPNQKLCED